MLRIAVLLFITQTLMGLLGACESPTSLSEPSSIVPQFWIAPECDPLYDPECELRDPDIDELNAVGATVNLIHRNGCFELSAWFTSGWGDKFRMWDAEVYRYEELLTGDFHPYMEEEYDVIHVFSGTDDFARTLAHELAEWAYPEAPHSYIRQRADECTQDLPW